MIMHPIGTDLHTESGAGKFTVTRYKVETSVIPSRSFAPCQLLICIELDLKRAIWVMSLLEVRTQTASSTYHRLLVTSHVLACRAGPARLYARHFVFPFLHICDNCWESYEWPRHTFKVIAKFLSFLSCNNFAAQISIR
jgi:hypothetical protein